VLSKSPVACHETRLLLALHAACAMFGSDQAGVDALKFHRPAPLLAMFGTSGLSITLATNLPCFADAKLLDYPFGRLTDNAL
jgi:hypothetical protein